MADHEVSMLGVGWDNPEPEPLGLVTWGLNDIEAGDRSSLFRGKGGVVGYELG